MPLWLVAVSLGFLVLDVFQLKSVLSHVA
jgi:hypothetical protein